MIASPSVERPLLHRYRVESALIMVDPNAISRFSQMASSFHPPCLLVSIYIYIYIYMSRYTVTLNLDQCIADIHCMYFFSLMQPLSLPHGTRPALLATVQELIACGIQKIAIIVPALPSSSSAVSDVDSLLQWQFLSAFHHSLSSSLHIDKGKAFKVTECEEGSKEWKPIVNDNENLKRRTRFFFQQTVDSDGTATGGFTQMLRSALSMLGDDSNDNDDNNYILAMRGECLPLRYLSSSSLQSSLSSSSSTFSSSSSSSTSSCVHSFLQNLPANNPDATNVKLSVCGACDMVEHSKKETCVEDDYFSPKAGVLQMSSSSSPTLLLDNEINLEQQVNFSGIAAFPRRFLSSATDEIAFKFGESSVWGDSNNEHKMNDISSNSHDDGRGRKSLHPLDSLIHSLMSFASSSSFYAKSNFNGVMCDGAYHHVGDEDGYRLVQEKIVLSKPFILDHIPINELEKAHARRSKESLSSQNLEDSGSDDNADRDSSF